MSLFGMKENFVGKGQSLDELIVKNKTATFFFEMSEEAMTPYISSGDILCVDRSITPVSNDVVVVSFEGALLCRRLVMANSEMTFTADGNDCAHISGSTDTPIWGVVTYVIRKVNR